MLQNTLKELKRDASQVLKNSRFIVNSAEMISALKF
jgi:hypothetical protein